MVPDCGIYVVKCLPTGRHYVGQSLHVVRRLRGHTRTLEARRHTNSRLQRAGKKHGQENFQFRQVLACAPEQRERIWRNNTKMWADPAHRKNIREKAGQGFGPDEGIAG